MRTSQENVAHFLHLYYYVSVSTSRLECRHFRAASHLADLVGTGSLCSFVMVDFVLSPLVSREYLRNIINIYFPYKRVNPKNPVNVRAEELSDAEDIYR